MVETKPVIFTNPTGPITESRTSFACSPPLNNFPNDTNLYVRLINGFHWIYTNPYLFINSGLKEKKTNLDKDTGKSTRLIRCGEELLSNYTRNDRFDLKKNTII